MDIDFQMIVEQYSTLLYRLAYSYCGNHADAEDVLQEVFLSYLCAKPSCSDEIRLRAWLMTVTANKCKDLLRSAWRKNSPLEQYDKEISSLDDMKFDIGDALQKLTPSSRGIVYLFYYEELSTKEIAQMLHLSQTAVRSRLFQARKKLKQLLGDDKNG